MISDTHGRFPPQVAAAFADVDLIIHAGDFNTNQVLAQFRELGKLKAVRGNTDYQSDLVRLPKSEVVQVGEVFIYVIHDLLDMDIDPRAAGFQVVIHGHLHVPGVRRSAGDPVPQSRQPHQPAARLKTRRCSCCAFEGDQVQAELISFN